MATGDGDETVDETSLDVVAAVVVAKASGIALMPDFPSLNAGSQIQHGMVLHVLVRGHRCLKA